MRIAVVAFGQDSAGDSAVALEIASSMSRNGLPEDVVLVNGGADALRALETVRAFDGVVIVDAVTMGDLPGSVKTFDLNDLIFSDRPASVTFHGMERDSELLLAHKFLNLPPTRIVAIEPATLQGQTISPALASNIDRYIRAVKDAIAALVG